MNSARANHVALGDGLALWVPEEAPDDFVEGEGPPLSFYDFVATRSSTNGSLAVVDTHVPAGNGPPLHLHDDADESFYVLEGEFEVVAGDDRFVISKGDFAFIPRGTLHIWKNNTDQPARMLRIYTPGGVEEFFADIGRPADRDARAPRLTGEDIRRAEEGAMRHYGPASEPAS